MKNLNLTLSVAVVAASAASAYGQSFSYTAPTYASPTGDVMLAIRDDAGVKNDVVINLGPITAFKSGGSFANLSINNLVSIKGNSGLSVASALQSVYGSTIPGNLDLNLFAVTVENNVPDTGYTGPGSTKASRSVYTISARTGSNAGGSQGTEDAPDTLSKASNGTAANTINTIGTSATSAASAPGANTKTGFVSIDPTLSLSYTQNLPLFVQNYGNTEVTTVSGKSTIVDFFYSPANNPGVGTFTSAAYLGNFTLTSKGQLFYVPVGSAVPEPREYALVAGLGLVAFAAWSRRSSK